VGRRLEDEGRGSAGWSKMDACEVRFQTLEGMMTGRMTRALREPQDMDDAIQDHQHRDTKPESSRTK